MAERKFLRGMLVALLTFAAAASVFAQDGGKSKKWYNSWAPGVEGSKIFINAGIGYGLLPYKMAIPPIAASVEYGLKNIPLSFGAYFAMATYKEETWFSEYKGSMMGFGARVSYHFNFVKKLDPYISLALGSI